VKLSSKLILKSIDLTTDKIAEADCVVIATDHSCFDYEMIVNNAKVLVDARNAIGHNMMGRREVIKILRPSVAAIRYVVKVILES
jgi:UDP-N-acetyl-D-glucosamine dehydrogenase